MTLRGRLLASSFALIGGFGLLFLALGLAVRAWMVPMLGEHLWAKTHGIARSLALELDVPLATKDLNAMRALTAVAERDPDFLGVTVADAAGAVMYQAGQPVSLPSLRSEVAALTVADRGGDLAIWAPVTFEGVGLGYVAAAFHKRRLEAVGRWMLVLASLTVVTLAAGALFSIRFSRTFVAPIRTMMDFSRRVAGGDFEQRLDCATTGELTELLVHLNAMVGALRSRDERLTQRAATLYDAARTDPLTQAGNRLRLSEDLAALVGRAVRYGHSYCAALCDVDNFKRYNDRYGHLAGDKALLAVVDAIRATLRQGDTFYRWGGEEFLIVLPEQTIAGALRAMERVRGAIEGKAVPHADAAGGVLTASIGFAVLQMSDAASPDGWIKRADEALYRAKSTGRNRVVAWEPTPAEPAAIPTEN